MSSSLKVKCSIFAKQTCHCSLCGSHVKAYVVAALSTVKMGKQSFVELRQFAQEHSLEWKQSSDSLDNKELSTHNLCKQPRSTHAIKYQAHTETTREARSDVTQLPLITQKAEAGGWRA